MQLNGIAPSDSMLGHGAFTPKSSSEVSAGLVLDFPSYLPNVMCVKFWFGS